MKKASLSIWMWISAGIIMSIIIFSISLTYMSHLVEDKKQRDMISGFNLLKERINMWCYEYKGSKDEGIIFPLTSDLSRMYLTNKTFFESYEENRNTRIKETKKGDILCIELKNSKIPTCFKLKCDAYMNKSINLKNNEFLKNLILNSDANIYYRFTIYKNESKVDINYKLIS